MNPEFKRYLWLELTLHRLIATSLILGVFFFTAVRFGSPELAANTALIGFIIVTMFWGSKQASESIIDEFNDNTWDNQRMSSLSPWRMTWGKVFGSTSYAWFAGLLCLMVYLVYGAEDNPFVTQLVNTLSLVLFAVTMQSIALISGVMSARTRRNSRNQWFMILLIIFIGPSSVMQLRENVDVFSWYNIDFSWSEFFLFSGLMWAAWTLYGAHRLMRRELQFSNGPIPWLLFLFWLAFYISGFVKVGDPDISVFAIQSSMVFFTMLVLSYLLLFTEPLSLIDLRRLVLARSMIIRHHYWVLFPLWMVTLVVTVIAAVVATWALPLVENETMTELLPPILLLFLLRDAAIILMLRISKHHERAGMAGMIYLLVLYGLSNWVIEMTGLDVLQPLFSPQPELGVMGGVIPPLIMTATFIFLAAYQFRQRIFSAEQSDS